MNSRMLGLLALALVLGVTSLSGQSRERRGGRSSRIPPLPADRNARPETRRDPGTVTPPEPGYVPTPAPPPAGSLPPALITNDPVSLAYWEMYDRDRRVTVSGKVTDVVWSHPNSYIFIVANEVEWAIEANYVEFREANVVPAVRVDDVITISGFLPKDDPPGQLPARRSVSLAPYLKENHLFRAGEINTAYGQRLAMGRPPTDDEIAQRLACKALEC